MSIIYLVGARGSGKTSLGAMLEREKGFCFADLDAWIQREAGKNIAEIVGESGWSAFRALESHCLARASGLLGRFPRAILATGGGAVLSAENRKFMREHGLVFWLNADAETLEKRLAANPKPGQRPSLGGAGLLAEIRQTLLKREKLYALCAHYKLDAALSLPEICEKLLNILASDGVPPPIP